MIFERTKICYILKLTSEEFDKLTPLETTIQLKIAESFLESKKAKEDSFFKYLANRFDRIESLLDSHLAMISALIYNSNSKEQISYKDFLRLQPDIKESKGITDEQQAAIAEIFAKAKNLNFNKAILKN